MGPHRHDDTDFVLAIARSENGMGFITPESELKRRYPPTVHVLNLEDPGSSDEFRLEYVDCHCCRLWIV